MFDLSDFWFIFFGSIALTIYYYVVIYGLGLFFFYLKRNKPDYWISNIYLTLVTFNFFYALITSLGNAITDFEISLFSISFKDIAFVIAILPAYLKILFFALVFPFTKEE